MHVSTGAQRGQKHQVSLDLDLQDVSGCLMWVLGMDLGASGRLKGA